MPGNHPLSQHTIEACIAELFDERIRNRDSDRLHTDRAIVARATRFKSTKRSQHTWLGLMML